MSSSLVTPILIATAFASGAGPQKGLVNPLGTILNGVLASPSISPGASLADGFPILTMTNPLAGGVAAAGADFNGLGNLITSFQSWVNAGGQFPFNATLAAAIGGYPIGAVLQLNGGLGCVVSTVNGNSQDPNAAMTGWAPWAGPAFAVSQAATAFNAAGVAPAFTLTPSPALPALGTNDCYNVTFSAGGTTGSNTLNVSGLGAKALMQYDLNGALQPAVITSGMIAVVQYNGTYWVVLDALPSSTISSAQQTLITNEGAPGSTVPIFKAGVLSTAKGATSVSMATPGTYYDLTPAASMNNTMVLPANFFVTGKTIKIELPLGWFTVPSTPTTLSVELLVGGSAFISLSCPISSVSPSTVIEAWISCQQTGVSGAAQFLFGMRLTGLTAGVTVGETYVSSGISTITANTLDIKASLAAGTAVTSTGPVIISVLG